MSAEKQPRSYFFWRVRKARSGKFRKAHIPNQLNPCCILPEAWHVRGRTHSGSRLCKSLDFFSMSGREMQL
jgi:hypothetical protein